MADDFTAKVAAWVQKSEAAMTAVFRESAQTVANDVRIPVGDGGNMPVKTGNLRRSLAVSTHEMPQIVDDAKSRYNTDPGSNITLSIAQAKLGDTIWLGFQANYAPYMENMYGFVRLTAQRWQQIVSEAASKIKGGS
jgi:hypothetical protein